MEYREAEKLLLDRVKINDTEQVDLKESFNRILSSNLISNKDVPNFNRSPLDGYCFNYLDTKNASNDNPIYFDIIEEVPCGKVATKSIGKNQTIKLMTGAKLPIGANCIIRYEDVELVDGKLKLCQELNENQNVIFAGEDVKNGELLAKNGDIVDMGVVGISASLGLNKLDVYKKLKVGYISTGTELLEIGENEVEGKIYNSNRYIFESILRKYNVDFKYYGIVSDDLDKLVEIFDNATKECDVVLSTGGVSVGDYDLIYDTLIKIGFDVFANGINMKPGMACCFGEKNGKIVLGLSGNPMSSVTTFYAVCLSALKKMMGYNDFENKYHKAILMDTFNKKIGKVRFLRAKVLIEDGKAVAYLNNKQGNIVIKSMIDCNAMIRLENVDEATKGMEVEFMYL